MRGVDIFTRPKLSKSAKELYNNINVKTKTDIPLYASHVKAVFFLYISGKDQVAFGVVP